MIRFVTLNSFRYGEHYQVKWDGHTACYDSKDDAMEWFEKCKAIDEHNAYIENANKHANQHQPTEITCIKQ